MICIVEAGQTKTYFHLNEVIRSPGGNIQLRMTTIHDVGDAVHACTEAL